MSELDILAIGSVYDLAKADVSLNPRHCPGPSDWILLATGLTGLGVRRALRVTRRSESRVESKER